MQIDHKANYLDKSHFRQQIMRARREGLANLRQAHPTDQQYRRVSLRISALCLEHLRLLDETYRDFDDFLNEPRGPHHQQWASDRAGHYLQQVELAIDANLSTGIRHIGSELSNPPGEVIREVIIQPIPTWYQQTKADWGRLPGWFRFSLLASLVVVAIIVLAR